MRIWIALIVLLALPASASASPFAGLGTWIDIYDTAVIANPAKTVATARAHGVKTIYLETSNSTQRHTVVNAPGLRRLIAEAHAQSVAVVVWYLPTLENVNRDRTRILAATTFAGAGSVDGLAVDIESSAVSRPTVRNRRLLKLMRAVRRALPTLPLASIIPSPPGMVLRPTYWPGFPYAELSALSDAWIPMCYYSYHATTTAQIAPFAHDCVQLIKAATPNVVLPIHVAGGLAGGTTRAGTRAFADQVARDHAAGISLYDFATTRSGHWRALRDAGW